VPSAAILNPALCQGRCAYKHLRASGSTALPQGPSLRSGLCCPGPSSLKWPHPPHSRAHPDFTVSRLIPDAFAVPICIGLGDPRLVLSFHRCSFATCRPLRPRGTPRLHIPSTSPKTLAFNAALKVSAFPSSSHSDSGEGICFRGLTTVRLRYDLLLCLPSCRS
jgi:hypothetical protein